MAGLDWYPRYSRKALDGMRTLSLELRGAYGTLLDLIYDRGGPVPDDDRWLAGWMGVSVRRWRQIRDDLLAEGRIVLRETSRGGALSDELAEKEIENQTSRRRTNAESGALGGRKSAETRCHSKENSGLAEANATADAQAPLKLKTETVQDRDSLSSPAGDREKYPSPFEDLWKAYPHIKGRSSKSKAYGFWRRFPAHVRDQLPAAVARYAREGREPKADCGAPAMQRWLSEERYEDWLAPSQPALSQPATPEILSNRLQRYADTGEWLEAWGPRPEKAA